MTIREYDDEFKRILHEAIERTTPPKVRQKESVVLAIPDLHCPFQHPDGLEFLKLVKRKFHPTTIVCLGDEIDAHSYAKWMPDPDGHSPGKEIELAIEALIPFYREFPDVLVCESNHTTRPWKKGFNASLSAVFLRDVEKVLKAPDGWRWEDAHEVDGVKYVHGDPYTGEGAEKKWLTSYNQSVVIGHIHSYAGVKYRGNLFAMNAGCLIDKSAYAFKYAKKMPIAVSLGCGLVVNGETAYFLPMRTDKHGRWIGRL